MSQDLFALHFINNKNGYFVDLGCGNGINLPNGNNTFLLEKNGWSGLSVDYNFNYINEFKTHRNTEAVLADMTTTSLKSILEYFKAPSVIDFFSFDVDDATDAVMANIPFSSYKFKLITFEHNIYYQPELKLKQRGYELFTKNGYERLIDNVILNPQGAVEDWYIYPELITGKKIFLKDIEHSKICPLYGFKPFSLIEDKIYNE